MYTQYIFTAQPKPYVSEADLLQIAKNSLLICGQMGLTGRVWTWPNWGIGVTEGPSDIAAKYMRALASDERIQSVETLSERKLSAPELSDYSVWLSFAHEQLSGAGLYPLKMHQIGDSLPASCSTHLRMMTKAHLMRRPSAA